MLAFSAFSGGRVEVRARAKVNLGLEVLGRRADGYHELRSVMWAIELADRVTLEASGSDIALECAAPGVPRTPDNLAWRAAELARQDTRTVTGLRIRIEKRIPVAAGLGGGSTDAAAVLAGFRSLRKSGPGPRRLGAMAVALGMDVPFFLGRSPALASGRGEELRTAPGEHWPVARAGESGLPAGDARRLRAARACRLRRWASGGRPGDGAPPRGGGDRRHRHQRARARGGAAVARAGRGQGGACWRRGAWPR